MAQPEKLSLWDRIFNRYRKEIAEEGSETWTNYEIPECPRKYTRNFVKYRVIDRVTGSETIEKKYLNGD